MIPSPNNQLRNDIAQQFSSSVTDVPQILRGYLQNDDPLTEVQNYYMQNHKSASQNMNMSTNSKDENTSFDQHSFGKRPISNSTSNHTFILKQAAKLSGVENGSPLFQPPQWGPLFDAHRAVSASTAGGWRMSSPSRTPQSRGTVGTDLRNEVDAVNAIIAKNKMTSTLDIYMAAMGNQKQVSMRSPTAQTSMMFKSSDLKNLFHHGVINGPTEGYDFSNHGWVGGAPPSELNATNGWKNFNKNAAMDDIMFLGAGASTEGSVGTTQSRQFRRDHSIHDLQRTSSSVYRHLNEVSNNQAPHFTMSGLSNSKSSDAWRNNRSCMLLSQLESKLQDELQKLSSIGKISQEDSFLKHPNIISNFSNASMDVAREQFP
eukprot:GDKJ01045389.1.p1 GENE.GDKJ01045389.1~~GDKJ01045389.1.p1  ORF type:complete len:374 (-),score=66.32 GDKJ01045389.1:455-1576(-)